MGRRTTLLIASILVAALGTALVYLWARGADQRAQHNQETIGVVFARGEIVPGTSAKTALSLNLLETRQMPQAYVPSSAVHTVDELGDDVAAGVIAPNQVVVQAMFAPAGQSGGANALPPKKLAVAVPLSDPARVAGSLVPLSEVTIFVTMQDQTTGAVATRVLLKDVTVLKVGATGASTTSTSQSSQTAPKEQVPNTILTLALSTKEAQAVILANKSGELWFGLRGPDSEVDTVPPTTLHNLFDQVS